MRTPVIDRERRGKFVTRRKALGIGTEQRVGKQYLLTGGFRRGTAETQAQRIARACLLPVLSKSDAGDGMVGRPHASAFPLTRSHSDL